MNLLNNKLISLISSSFDTTCRAGTLEKRDVSCVDKMICCPQMGRDLLGLSRLGSKVVAAIGSGNPCLIMHKLSLQPKNIENNKRISTNRQY